MERINLDEDFRDWVILHLPLQVLIDMYDRYKSKKQISIVLFNYGESIDERASLAEMGPITEEEIDGFEEFLRDIKHL